MTTVQQSLGNQAQTSPFTPDADLPQSDVWSAVKWVREQLASAVTSLTALITTAQYTGDDAKTTALEARSAARRARLAIHNVNAIAVDARNRAMLAQAAKQQTRRAGDAQISLSAQVFN